MDIDVEKWFSHLPIAEEQAGDGIVVSGKLVSGETGKFHILVGELRLSFLPEDILEIESVPTSEPLFHQEPRDEVSVVVRRGASVQDIRPSALCEQVFPQRRPFALSVRPFAILLDPCPRFRHLEHEFLANHSLIDDDSNSVQCS